MSGLTSTRKVSREQLTQNYRRGAINYLFMYLYVMRHGRPPEGWEIGLARSLLTSDVVFLSEPENEDIKAIYNLVLDVDRLMNRAEGRGLSVEAESSKTFSVPCKNEPDEAEREFLAWANRQQ